MTKFRKGMTLVEVVAAIMLLTVLMVGIVSAFSTHRDQIELAQETVAAIQVADIVLDEWYNNAEPIPLNQSGRLDSYPNLAWQTSVTQQAVLAGVDVFHVEFQVYSQIRQRPLITVNLVESAPKPQEVSQ